MEKQSKTKRNHSLLSYLLSFFSAKFHLLVMKMSFWDCLFLPKTLVQSADWLKPVATAFHSVDRVLLAPAGQKTTLTYGKGTKTHLAHHSVHMAERKGLGRVYQAQSLGCTKEETGL